MKKLLGFFRSMKFGMILLALVVLFSFAGSIIPQQRTHDEYVSRYGEQAAGTIEALLLDDVFSAWYFLALLAVLCLNLLGCSIVRLPRAKTEAKRLAERAENAGIDKPFGESDAERLHAVLKSKGFKRNGRDGCTVYSRGAFGAYGSFLTHIGVLLILCAGAAVLFWSEVSDRTVMPGSSITLDDGTIVSVEAFSIENEAGELDFTSSLHVEGPDGKTADADIRVNEPLSFGSYKIYQQTYGTAGAVLVTNSANGASEIMTLSESCFLTLDGVNGMFFQALYPGYVEGEDGGITLITSTQGEYSDPVYDLLSVSDGTMTPVLAFPGDTLTIGDVSYTVLDPISYPGLRIKHTNGLLMALLYASFALLLIGLWLCFFAPPVCVKVTAEGYAVVSSKPQAGLVNELEAAIKTKKPI